MAVFEIQRQIKAHSDVVWKVISNHNTFVEIAPDITKVEKVSGDKLGLVQRLSHKSGIIWEEECVEWKEKSSYTMQVVTRNYPLPVTKMRRTCSMQEGPNNILIKLSYEYTPGYGPLGGLLNKFHILPVLKMYSHHLMDNLVGKICDTEWGFRVTAATILKKKGNKIISIGLDSKGTDAIRILAENKIGSVLVLDPDGKIAGILSERDIVNDLVEFGRDMLDQSVSKIMTHKVITFHPDDTLQELMTCMTERRIRHLPIIDGEKVVGIISIGDIVKARMEELETESAAMREYIKGRRWRELSLHIGRDEAANGHDSLDNAMLNKK